jgi:hypothetical protein
MSKAHRWCYTINNPTSEPPSLEGEVKYHIYGSEVGESGTPHYQGFIIFQKPKRLTQLKKLLSDRGHYEVTKGKNSQASDYCKKEGNYKEFGELPADRGQAGGQATKERYSLAFTQAKTGALDSIDHDLLVKHYRTFKQIKMDYVGDISPLDYLPGIWIYGESGIGKSRYARATYAGAYVKNCNKWWDHYQGEENVIIDDFDDTHACLGHHLKRWGDHYSFIAETKGGSILIRPKWIVVTSQYNIEDIFKDGNTVQALLRRFKVINFNKSPLRVSKSS